ncbi:hypothetical protein NUH16_003066 [Penicillium rubens]|nr:hypothetical protein NUH16_003066 [Penicillium rubens]
MALAQIDTGEAFAYLQVNLPALISRITDLSVHTSAKHTEYYEACRRQENPRLPCPTSGSVRPAQPNKARIGRRRNYFEFEKHIAKAKGSMGPLECFERKRCADEVLSIDRNEPFALVHKRHKVIIEYDGHTQKVLEEVVQDIGICRSNIRRAKMSMMQTRFFAKPLDKTSCLVNHLLGESEPSQEVASKLVRRIQTDSGMIGVIGSQKIQGKSTIDLADKQLILAHELCETAAYQALRTGDCVSEVDSAVKNFKNLLELASNEVRRLKEQKLQQTAEETFATAQFNPTAARLARARVAAVATREPSTVGTSIIEVDDASYFSAESVNRLEFPS